MAQEIVGVKIQIDGQDAAQSAQKSIGSIRKELKEANAELIAAQRNYGQYSKEAVVAAKRVAELKDAVADAREAADLFDPGKKFQAFSGALSAVAGGFSAVQGALGLVGVESEEVQKQLLKVQSALALSQGLNEITDAAPKFAGLAATIRTKVVTAFSTLRGAIAATGIGIIAVGLGLLVANFDKVVAAIRRVIPGFDAFTNTIGRAIDAITDFIGITSEADRALETLNKANKERNEEIDRTIKVLSAQGGKEKEIYQLQREQLANQLKDLTEKERLGQKLTDDELKRKKDLIADTQALDASETKRQNDAAQERNKKAQDAAKQRRDQEVEQERARLEAIKAQQDAFDDAEKARGQKILAQILDANKVLDDAIRERELSRLEGKEKELRQLELQYFDQQAAAQGNFFALLALEQAYLINRKAINDKFDEETDEKTASNAQKSVDRLISQFEFESNQRKQNAEAQLAIEQAKNDALIAGAQEVSKILGGLVQLAGRNTAASKVLAIAQATIDTYASVATVFAQAAKNPATIPFPAFPYLQAGAALVAGLARVKAITSVQVPFAAGGGGGGGNAPSVRDVGTAPIAPSLPLTQTVTQLQSRTINELQSATTRAYVIESDVTGAQERIRRLNRAARLG
jgi:hypothetical protein